MDEEVREEEMETTENPEVEVVEEAENTDPVAVLEAKNKELADKLLRSQAEFDNFRKRSITEKQGMYQMGVVETVEKMLPVIDTFTLGIKNLDERREVDKGILMIYRQFEGFLEALGVEVIQTVGEAFDANLHNAVASGPEEGFEPGTVCVEMQRGYKYKDKVIRHSMVKVAD